MTAAISTSEPPAPMTEKPANSPADALLSKLAKKPSTALSPALCAAIPSEKDTTR